MLRSFLDGAVFGTEAGDGPARVLLLHGWRRNHADFAEVARELADASVATLAIDLPGFGSSPPPSAPAGARGYAEALVPLLDELAASGPLLLVGHSFGGRVAVCLGAGRPEHVAGLVLTGVPLLRAVMPHRPPSLRYRGIKALARRHLLPASVLESARRRHGSEDYRASSGVMRDVLVATVAESYDVELAALRCPVALLWGERDTTAPEAVARAAVTRVPGATLTVLDGIGHFVPTEAPVELAASVATMLQGAR